MLPRGSSDYRTGLADCPIDGVPETMWSQSQSEYQEMYKARKVQWCNRPSPQPSLSKSGRMVYRLGIRALISTDG